MHFVVAGVSHDTASTGRLERLVVPGKTLPTVLLQATHLLGEAVILSTCHRTEVYTVAEDADTSGRRLLDFLRLLDRRQGEPAGDLGRYAYVFSDDEAARHLFRVTCGLDALVLGEPEIVNQVSRALRAAGEASTVSHRLSRLFHHALRTSRKVRTRTGISRNSVSVSAIGVRLLQRSIGDLSGKDALLVGVGETGGLAARALRRAGVRSLTVASRRPERGRQVAAELGTAAIPMSALADAISEVDVVVTCTSATAPVISAEDLRTAIAHRPERPLFVLDLALPADVEAPAANVPGVTLYGLSALKGIAEEHRAERVKAAAEAEELIEREVDRFNETLTGVDAEPVIKALGERAESLRRREVERALKQLRGLDSDGAEVIEAMSRAIVKRLLADPITYLRAGGDSESAAAIVEAFDLRDGANPPTDAPSA